MKRMLVLVCLLVLGMVGANAQKAAVALEGDHTLRERYQLMKTNSQTFQDYKVIKETILDAVWKISGDTIAALGKSLAEAESSINSMESKVKIMEAQVREKEKAMAEMEFDSSHVTVAGVAVGKGLFLTITGVTIVALLVLLGSTAGALKLSQRTIKEKDLSLYGLTAEFDDFRKKALDKEIKLSRQLQNERNKLAELSK